MIEADVVAPERDPRLGEFLEHLLLDLVPDLGGETTEGDLVLVPDQVEAPPGLAGAEQRVQGAGVEADLERIRGETARGRLEQRPPAIDEERARGGNGALEGRIGRTQG